MKRLFILLLLVLMPLQLVWAATDACCSPEDGAAAQHLCHGWQAQCDDDDAGTALDDDGCDCCHHFSGSALMTMRAQVNAPAQLPAGRFIATHYISHIPDLVPPPDRLARA